ncbi:MAG: translation elongation factor Ts [Bacteroidia bacterium]
MSTVQITASDVNKLRQKTGAGMMDCKKALMEANGDFEAAIDYLRKKGQKVAINRSDREATEGVIMAKASDDNKKGVIVMVNCETDFVAKNQDFITFTEKIAKVALANNVRSAEDLKEMEMDGTKISDHLFDQIGKIGEKIELSEVEVIEAPFVVVYNHPGYRLASMVGFSGKPSNIQEVGKDVAMQIAAMAPVAIDKDDVDTTILERELEIAREQIRTEGKPEEMVEKIAQGKLNKFYKENTLLNQNFIKDEKKTVGQLLISTDANLQITAIRRLKIGN